MRTLHFAQLIIAGLVSGAAFAQPVSGTINGQTVHLTLCDRFASEGLDVTPGTPTKTFSYKGTVTNVFAYLRFDPPIAHFNMRFTAMITKNGAYETTRDITFTPGGKAGSFDFTLLPGEYEIAIVNKYKDNDVFVKQNFTVKPDTVGDRAMANIKSGIGKLTLCEHPTNAGCAGEISTWKAGRSFALMCTMPLAAQTTQTMWVIHQQNPDGTDGQWVNEWVHRLGNTDWKSWWTGDDFTLPVGKYTIYSISASKAQVSERSGNLKEYFAKATLTVQ